MGDYSDAAVLEGDNPVAFADFRVFVTSALPTGKKLFVRRKRDRAAEERAKADAMEDLLRKPDGVAEFVGQMFGGSIVDMARRNPQLFEEARTTLLAGIALARKAPPPKPTEHSFRGSKIPVTAVVANLTSPGDPGRKKALARVAGTFRTTRSR